MAPQRKAGSKSDNATANQNVVSPPSNQPAQNTAVTREELNDIVVSLRQQMETQNTLMMEKLTTFFATQPTPPVQRIVVDEEENGNSSASGQRENLNAQEVNNAAG